MWSGSADVCALTGGLDPNCVMALATGQLTYTPMNGGGQQPTPATFTGCPLCTGGTNTETLAQMQGALQSTNGLDQGGVTLAWPGTNPPSWFGWYTNRMSGASNSVAQFPQVFSNGVSSTSAVLTNSLPWDTSSVCVVVNPYTQAVAVVAGNVGVSVDTLLGMTNWPNQNAREIASAQAMGYASLSNWLAGVGTSVVAQSAWSNVVYTYSNLLVYPYIASWTNQQGVQTVSSNMVDFIGGWRGNLENSQLNPGGDVGSTLANFTTNYPGSTWGYKDLEDGGTCVFFGSAPTTSEVRDANLVLCVSNPATGFLSMGMGPVWINVDPFQSRWIRFALAIMYVAEGWVCFAWGAHEKWMDYTAWYLNFCAGYPAAAAMTSDEDSGSEIPVWSWVVGRIFNWVSGGVIATAVLSLVSFVSSVWSTVTMLHTFWPMGVQAGAAAVQAATPLAGPAVVMISWFNTILGLLAYTFPVRTFLITMAEIWFFRANVAAIGHMSMLRAVAIGKGKGVLG